MTGMKNGVVKIIEHARRVFDELGSRSVVTSRYPDKVLVGGELECAVCRLEVRSHILRQSVTRRRLAHRKPVEHEFGDGLG
jgi:hypothetical protein